MAHYFCLCLILSLQPLELPKESLTGKEKVETMWPGIGAKEGGPSPGLLVPLVLVCGPRSPRRVVLKRL